MPFIDLFVCVLQCSMKFGAQDVVLKEKGSKACQLLVNMHFRKFRKYFIRTLLGALSYAVFRAAKVHPYEAIWQPSVQELRAFYFIQGSSWAEQI